MATPRKSAGTIADTVEVSEYKGGKIVEKRTTLKNDSDIDTPKAPEYFVTGATYKGKFFPRGCRGNLIDVQIYCKRTGTGTINLNCSPQPGLGPIFVVTITPDADWNWKSASINKFWNYDSLFIWVTAYLPPTDVSFGYDEEREYDGYTSDDDGATWSKEDRRYFIRASISGQTVGDIPFSGTANVIEVPGTLGVQTEFTVTIAPGSESGMYIEGIGNTILIEWYVASVGARDNVRPRLEVDGAAILPHDVSFSTWYNQYVGEAASGAGIYFTRYDTTNNYYNFRLCLRIPFRRKLSIKAYNAHASSTYIVVISIIVEKLT